MANFVRQMPSEAKPKARGWRPPPHKIVVIHHDQDYVKCLHRSCGALLPIPRPEICPRCLRR